MNAEVKPPDITGFWNWQEMDSGTGSIVYKVQSIIGTQAVKWFALEGSESLTIPDLVSYKNQTRELATWMDSLRDDLRKRTYTDGEQRVVMTWKTNRIHSVGSTMESPYTISYWVNGYSCADIIEQAQIPSAFAQINTENLAQWLVEEIKRIGRLYRFNNPYSSPLFIPVARNIIICPTSSHSADLTVVDIRDYIRSTNQPVSRFAKRRFNE